MRLRIVLSALLCLVSACAGTSAADDTPSDTDAATAADAATPAAADAATGPVPDAAGAPDAAAVVPDAAPAPDATMPPPGVDPGLDGPYGVVRHDAQVPAPSGTDPANVTLFAPSTDGTNVAAGSFPLIVVSPGFQMDRGQYASYAHHLATHGFVAVTQSWNGGLFDVDHAAFAAQSSRVIDWALSPASGVAAHVDAAKIGAAGHSLGGKISLLTAAQDHRVRAVVGWDPVDANTPSVTPELMGQIDATVLVLGETLDAQGGFMPCAPAADNFQQYFTTARSPALEVTVNGAGHMDFVDDPSCPFCGFCAAHTADPFAIKAVARRATVAWFRRRLLGDTTMDTYLTGAVMQGDARVSFRAK
jgi:predicted dienelactone hydrolase